MPNLLIADISIISIGPIRGLGRRQNIPRNRQQPADRGVLRPR